MCGFVGVLKSKITSSDLMYLSLMSDSISHRGPDSSGLWSDNSVFGVAHQRLKIIDLTSTGSQPMISNSNRYVVAFNGEIYNHKQLRKELEIQFGVIAWKGTSDTETLLKCVEIWGIQLTLKKINGMFSFSIWDAKTKLLTLARDKSGEKPIYYGWQKNAFLFGSELKALKKHPRFESKIDRTSVALMLKYKYVPSPRSIYKNIYKLEPGCSLSVSLKEREFKVSSYWMAYESAKNSLEKPFFGNINDATLELDRLLSEVVNSQMQSDVSLGAFLSGGIDSSIICALMNKSSNRPIETFSIGFKDKQYDEAHFAKKVAQHIGTNHHELYVSPNEAMKIIPNLSSIYCEPFADVSQIPTILISGLASQNVKVALTGDGGDELFGGYNRYLLTNRFWGKINLLPTNFRALISRMLLTSNPHTLSKLNSIRIIKKYSNNIDSKFMKGLRFFESNSIDNLYQNLISSNIDIPSILVNYQNEQEKKPSQRYNLKIFNNEEILMFLDFMSYLPDDILVKVDRASMSRSIEARVPFLDHRVFEFAWALPMKYKISKGINKVILRQLLSGYIPSSLIDRPKMGFEVPIGNWLRGPLRNWAGDLLNESRLNNEGFFSSKIVSNMWTEHLNQKRDWQNELWNILMFQSWLEENL